MFSALPFSDAKFELAISVLQQLNFHLAMPNYGLTFDSPRNGDGFSAVPLVLLPLLLLTNLNAGLTFDSSKNGDDFSAVPRDSCCCCY